MYLWISGGGTGGHIYPALTVLDALGPEAARVLWLGTAGGLEARLVAERGLPFRAVSAGPLVGTGPLAFARNLLRLARGAAEAWRLLGAERPDLAFVTGGYVSVPLALAARLRRVPLAVYLPDVRPGEAVKWIARLANRVLVTSEASRGLLPSGKVVVTGYPVRRAVLAADRAAARAALGLDPAGLVLLVFGGSQGARHLNQAVLGLAPEILARAELVHVAGPGDADRARAARAALPAAAAARYHLADYLDSEDMARALAAADLAVCRAGAATLGELPARGLGAILVPLPIARGHQDENARLLVAAGAARLVADAELDTPRFGELLLGLLDDPAARAALGEAARRLARPGAAEHIARELASLAAAGPARAGGGAA